MLLYLTNYLAGFESGFAVFNYLTLARHSRRANSACAFVHRWPSAYRQTLGQSGWATGAPRGAGFALAEGWHPNDGRRADTNRDRRQHRSLG